MTLTAAVGELTRVLPWSLRALGYPFGTADRAAHLVALAAALDPFVLDRIARAGRRPEGGARIARLPEGLHVKARGSSLFEIGPAVIDCLAAHAGAAPVVTARVTGATDPELLPAVALTGAGYGLRTVILDTAKAGSWVAAGPEEGGRFLHSGTGRAALLAGLPDGPMAARVRTAGAGAGLLFLASEQTAPFAFPTPGRDAAAALATANAHGIPVSQATLEALYALEMITWAPTSERSRAQAGFTPKAATA